MANTTWSMSKEEWIDDSPKKEDIDMLKKEAKGDSMIDKVNFRQEMISMWTSKTNGVQLRIRELPGRTRVVFLGTDEQFNKIPWTLWSRIFQAIAHPVGRILFYGHPSKRFFPTNSQEPGPENVNGGYTNICTQERIVIYRFEEATRVLLHELLHTACFDTEKGVEELEAHTEAWTEIFMCAILSEGNLRKFRDLWLKQCKWIYHQCAKLGKIGPDSYAWRYINGKRDVLDRLGFLENCNEPLAIELTPRFTTPEWPI